MLSAVLPAPAQAASKPRIARNLAPFSSLHKTEFREKYKARELIVSHEVVNRYIADQIKKILDVRGEEGLVQKRMPSGDTEVRVIAIPGLLRKTGQFAHIGLGRQYGEPVVYIDWELYDDPDILQHETEEIARWENHRASLKLDPEKMRDWIQTHIAEAKRLAREFHEASHPLSAVYDRYTGIDFELDYIDTLCALYGFDAEEILYNEETAADINLAAGGSIVSSIVRRKSTSLLRRIRSRIRSSWIARNSRSLVGKKMVTLSMEGNIPELIDADSGDTLARDANTKGGLGAYQGDKLEGLSMVGMDAAGIQPMYSHARVGDDLVPVDYSPLLEKGILEEVFTGDEAITVWAGGEDYMHGRQAEVNVPVQVEVYRINRGGTWVYLLKSDVFDELYTNDRIHRFTQEIVFGKAAYQLLKDKLELAPDILHLNEAHTVVAAAQMRSDTDNYFDNMSIIYTNHTIVPAGLEKFSEDEVHTNLNRMLYQIGIPQEKAEEYASRFLSQRDGKTVVDYCKAAFTLADVVTAVSAEHAVATKQLFERLYPDDFHRYHQEVIPILNGSGTTWKNDEILAMEKTGAKPTGQELWDIHQRNKEQVYAELAERMARQTLKEMGKLPEPGKPAADQLAEIQGHRAPVPDVNKPTVWAVRRLVDYKSQYPMLRFLVHVMCADRDTTYTREELWKLWERDIPEILWHGYDDDYAYNQNDSGDWDVNEKAQYILDQLFADSDTVSGLGMQVVLGGPEYEKNWVKEFRNWTSDIPELKGKVFYIPNSDAGLLRMQSTAADICINMPRPLEEACGTSDQRTALNGGVNIALRGAGPVEWMTDYDEDARTGSGFFLGSYTRQTERGVEGDVQGFYRQAPLDIFGKLTACSRLYYDEEHDRADWKQLMHNAYMASTYGSDGKKAVTSQAMEERYAKDVYPLALRKRNAVVADRVRLSTTLRAMHDNRNYRDNPISVKDLTQIVGVSPVTAYALLNTLVDLGVVNVDRSGKTHMYSLSPVVRPDAGEAVAKAVALPELAETRIPDHVVPALRKKLFEILSPELAEAYPAVKAAKDLFLKLATARAEEELVYEIRYDRDRMNEAEAGIDARYSAEAILREYVRLLKLSGVSGARNILLRPAHLEDSLISVSCFKDRARTQLIGEGHINIEGPRDLTGQLLRVTDMLNMALAAASIRKGVPYDDMNEHEKDLISFIQAACKSVTGDDVAKEDVLEFIKNLPRAEPVPLEWIAEYNKLTRSILIAA